MARKDDEKLLTEAKERFKRCVSAEDDNRHNGLDDLNFLVGEQWDQAAKRDREQNGRPCLTINRLPQFIRQVVNDARQNRPGVKIHPIGDGADTDTAEVLQGMIRHIETRSAADVAYDTGVYNAVANGWGYWRVVTDYAHDRTFEQELKIERVRNPFTIYMDPECQEPTCSDARFAFVTDHIPKDQFEQEFPGKEQTDIDLRGQGDDQYLWYGEDTVRVAEYWCVKEEQVTLVAMRDGRVLDDDERDLDDPQDDDMFVASRRKITRRRVKWYLLSGSQILDERDWPGQYIPIVRVVGDEVDVQGKLILRSLIRDAKDPQKMYNYWSSAETEHIALSPLAPWVIEEGQLEGHEDIWAQANRYPYSYLPYKDEQGRGAPQRATPPQASSAIMQAKMAVADDMKGVTGIYDAALGQRSNETSGIAIRQRQMEGDTSTYHFIDNLSRAIRQTGRILIDLIPHIYDTDRYVRLLWEDGESSEARLVPGAQRMQQQMPEEYQQIVQSAERIADPTTGRYDVTVTVGPSYATKRQEAAESMMQFIQAYPQAANVIGDLIAKNMDWPGSEDIAERLKKMLPPGLADDSEPVQPPPDPEIVKAQQDMQIEQAKLQQQAEEARLEHQRKLMEMQVEAETKIATARIQAGTQVETASIKALADLEKQIEQIGGNLQAEDIRARQRDNQAAMQERTREATARMQTSPGQRPNGAGAQESQ